jgi:hypothetical protein
VITSLFYPALAIYSSSQPHLLARFSSGLGALAPQRDVLDVWAPHAALRARADSVARARCGIDGTLRAERVLARTDAPPPGGALSRALLAHVSQLERSLAARLAAARTPCLRAPDGGCFVVGPGAFWGAEPRSDADVAAALALGQNASRAGILLTPHMVLAEREAASDQRTLEWAGFASLTYFFPETDCMGAAGHDAWIRILREATGPRARVEVPTHAPKLFSLEVRVRPASAEKLPHLTFFCAQYDPHSVGKGGTSLLSWLVYPAYALFFFWASGSMRRLDTVHSRIGLAFTGLIEIIVSTITSLSVCALAGFKITMVPW